MPLPAGTKLGPYEILSPLGAGGMGEVYKAKDSKLGREVAIKVLPEGLATDKDSLARFEREAKAVAALSHPNILSIHDFGAQGGVTYAAMELLEGETLHAALAHGALPLRKVSDYSLQITRGLAAAHAKGIIHRDLKPGNIFITRDGQVKILDFGLAKATREQNAASPEDITSLPTEASPAGALTAKGTIMGTVGYMSPEQLMGLPVDPRSDIFSFGAVLYEMLAGERAFRRDTTAETMAAILHEEPPPLPDSVKGIPPVLDHILRHCLEKKPEQRFQSARDIAFDLEILSGISSGTGKPAIPAARRRPAYVLPGLLALPVLLGLLLAAFFIGRHAARKPAPSFQSLTFRRGAVFSARFAPDGRTILYGAAWDGEPFRIFSTRTEGPESLPLNLPPADVMSVSSAGKMAILLGGHFVESFVFEGTLAEAPLAGGESPREIAEDVQWADYSPDGKGLAIVRDVEGRNRLEYPVGNVLYTTAGWIGNPRFSPDGHSIALLDHWGRIGNLGSVVIVNLKGEARIVSTGWEAVEGMAWSPSGKEVWFTGTKSGSNMSLFAVTLSGKLRLVLPQVGAHALCDISPAGDVLMTGGDVRLGLEALLAGRARERDYSWLDWSALRDLSPDGKKLLFDENGEGGGPLGAIYLREADHPLPVKLSSGWSMGLSPDGGWALTSSFEETAGFTLVPTGLGQPRPLRPEGLALQWGAWMPGGKEILFSANRPGKGQRLYLQKIPDGEPRPISAEGVRFVPYSHLISPDGLWVAALAPDEAAMLFPIAGGAPRPIPGLAAGELPCGWSADGRSLFIYHPGELPAKVFRLDLASGRRVLWKELMPEDPTGVLFIRPPHITPDGSYYAYSFTRAITPLYLVKGLR